jgi:pimeloyl-ACP methyl ester carboxylesterase
MQAQLQAIIRFYKNEGGWYERLGEIVAPTLVANGDRDGAFPVIDSVVLAREIRKAELLIYPDAGHGFLFQDPARFAADVSAFLGDEDEFDQAFRLVPRSTLVDTSGLELLRAIQ